MVKIGVRNELPYLQVVVPSSDPESLVWVGSHVSASVKLQRESGLGAASLLGASELASHG